MAGRHTQQHSVFQKANKICIVKPSEVLSAVNIDEQTALF